MYEALRCEMRGLDRKNDVKLAKTTLFELVIMLREFIKFMKQNQIK